MDKVFIKKEQHEGTGGDKKATRSLVFGILSWLGIITVIIPIVFGIWSIFDGIKALRRRTKRKKSAVAGISLSILAFLFIVWVCVSGDTSDENAQSSIATDINQEKDITFDSTSEDRNTPSVPNEVINSEEIASNYEMYDFQMDCDEVIKNFQQRGYETVQLVSHIVKAPGDGKIGDVGTTDVITLKATHVDEKGYFSVTENYEVLYIYWGEIEGWDESIYESNDDKIFDFSGLNNTYWKLKNNDESMGEAAYDNILSYMDILTADDWDDSSIYTQTEIYISFINFDTFECVGQHSYESGENLATIIALSPKAAAIKDFRCENPGYNHKMKLTYEEYFQSWQIYLEMDELSFMTAMCWRADEKLCVPIEKSEFEEALNRAEILASNGQTKQDEIGNDELEY